ncbi:MAG: tRNA (adenosine(37)-N6)-threonylcarbamoyltransferase complex dimerization subunit type 1 TsaB [Endomicrobiales bacterium]|nr:tRNA (adenosine(37)-N6)-threonylcarbamoyltransferase complex dimerization subunit type 1 TsaB [Endomicrobiales bacterium]
MKILAIETSGSTFSVAVSDNGRLISEFFWHSEFRHSERLIPAIKRMLAEIKWELKDIERIAVSTGPGSFTGVRVGIACARTLAQGLGVSISSLDTLELLAVSAPKGKYRVLPVIDALREEVYVRSGAVRIVKLEDFLKKLKKTKGNILPVGNAVISNERKFSKTLGKRMVVIPESMHYPRAGILAEKAPLLKAVNYEKIKPLYVRKSWAEENKR